LSPGHRIWYNPPQANFADWPPAALARRLL